MNGFGDFIWASGKSYSGYYDKDVKEGLGLFFFNNPVEIYFGYWSQGQRDGPAVQISKDKKTYSYWEKGKREESFSNRIDAGCYCFNKVNVSRKYKYFFTDDLDDLIKKFGIKTN